MYAASGSEVKTAAGPLQLRSWCSSGHGAAQAARVSCPASASAMVDEGQPASGEQAGHGLLLWQPSSGAAAKPLEEDEEGDDELDDEAPGELTFSPAPRPKRRRRSGEFRRRCAGTERF